MLKVLRRIDEGINPEWEVGTALMEEGFSHVPAMLGALEYRPYRGEPTTLAVMQAFVPNQGDAWDFTLHAVDQYLTRALDVGVVVPDEPIPAAAALLEMAETDPPHPIADLIAPYLTTVRRLGQRTGELHSALGNVRTNPELAPVPFTTFAQRSLYQSMRGMTTRLLRRVREALPDLAEEARSPARAILSHEDVIFERFRSVLQRPLTGQKIRCHGDFHLAQVLRSEDDVIFIDFEGEPDRFVEERRLKTSPLRDVASMLYSLHFAAVTAGAAYARVAESSADERVTIDRLLRAWYRWAAAAFLGQYLHASSGDHFLPESRDEVAMLLDALILEKSIYEVGWALNQRPDSIALALRNVLDVLELDERDEVG